MTRTILVVGGGTAGNAVTVFLRRAGIDVDLVELDADWNSTAGSGITLQTTAMRMLGELGLLEQAVSDGFAFAPHGPGAVDGAAKVPDASEGPAPYGLGMQRPRLQQILIDAVRDSGANVRLGLSVTALEDRGDIVDVTFADGSTGRYDLVIGADGLHSAVRAMIGIRDAPESTGVGIWRAGVPRPPGLDHPQIAVGGACFLAACCPTSDTTAYAYLVERSRDRGEIEPSEYADEMARLADGYAGEWPAIRQSLTDPKVVNYTTFQRLLVEGPWHRGRVVLMGDAVHVCPPTLAQGAAMSLEDAWVLAELLSTHDEWDDALLTAYSERRRPRVQRVVDTSVQLGQWLLEGTRSAEVPALMARTMAELAKAP